MFDEDHPIGEAFVMGLSRVKASRSDGSPMTPSKPRAPTLPFNVALHWQASTQSIAQKLPLNIGPTTLEKRFAAAQKRLHAFGDISQAMQFGLNWLIDHAPANAPCVLLHGDFRTGNLLIDENGLAGVLDWELTHQGPAEEDLGYPLCERVAIRSFG